MGGAEGIGTSFYGHQIFLFQFSLKIIDENQRCMLKNSNFFPKPMYKWVLNGDFENAFFYQ